MRYTDDYDNDMLSIEDWDDICDRAMEEAMEMVNRNRYSRYNDEEDDDFDWDGSDYEEDDDDE